MIELIDEIKNSVPYKYAQEVVNGTIPNGWLVRLACKRYLEDFKRDDLIYDWLEVEDDIKFFTLFRHYKGVDPKADNTFYLSDWLQFIIANLMGWKYKSTKLRRFQTCLIQISRKNGKSFFTAGIANLFALDELGSEVCIAATSRAQASILYEMCATMGGLLDPSHEEIKALRNEIKIKSTKSHILCLHSDSDRLDGLRLKIPT